ncbi:MAG: hypothetical protein B7Y56_02705 [Gallionellales bacterium 35-53-114]|jgi:uncharacterized protein (DUF302 family)|nr:MAG: hypothetical protein B7Y56_02705 [Gallionellales bacterium 35-53-114]OYZ64526.1 MAG: hypothetical protein B7Y04_06485 [Gallionellales bacterium 24-53-125]OZB10168.1 MAG: hypothetical protein B7X61_01225 [Gallionellales bacterium 39-52-133]HQS56756.1 DUF302 domain-containing protein [Gallionellaceae bacterium]HQS75460.1 DUF302 domain-containing protein [Gallionellaceae bacterium]
MTYLKNITKGLILVIVLSGLTGCGTIHAMRNLEEGSGGTFMDMWDKWVESEGDIAVATTWAMKVKPGVTVEDIENALATVATDENIKAVGVLPLSDELQARDPSVKQKMLRVISYCSPTTARMMVDFSPAMAAFLPCRVVIVEKDDGLWLYTLNMDMMIKMGKKMPPELKVATMKVRNTIWSMMEKGASGEF